MGKRAYICVSIPRSSGIWYCIDENHIETLKSSFPKKTFHYIDFFNEKELLDKRFHPSVYADLESIPMDNLDEFAVGTKKWKFLNEYGRDP